MSKDTKNCLKLSKMSDIVKNCQIILENVEKCQYPIFNGVEKIEKSDRKNQNWALSGLKVKKVPKGTFPILDCFGTTTQGTFRHTCQNLSTPPLDEP